MVEPAQCYCGSRSWERKIEESKYICCSCKSPLWQPMETAPRHCPILIYGTWESELSRTAPKEDPDIFVAEYSYGAWCIIGGVYYSAFVYRPSYWMPLPPPPTKGDK